MRKKILVVEDHHDTSFALCRLLKLEGYEVEHAIDGRAGLNAALEQEPDLIVTDIHMPRMDGIEMIRQLRERSVSNSPSILVMSAYGKRVIEDALGAGANFYLEKPIDFDRLLALVKNILESY